MLLRIKIIWWNNVKRGYNQFRRNQREEIKICRQSCFVESLKDLKTSDDPPNLSINSLVNECMTIPLSFHPSGSPTLRQDFTHSRFERARIEPMPWTNRSRSSLVGTSTGPSLLRKQGTCEISNILKQFLQIEMSPRLILQS